MLMADLFDDGNNSREVVDVFRCSIHSISQSGLLPALLLISMVEYVEELWMICEEKLVEAFRNGNSVYL
ncbi:hypothetical protein D3C79_956720 [compost metagenome]